MITPLRLEPELWDTVPGTQVLKVVEALHAREVDVGATLARFGLPKAIKPDTPIDLRRAAAWTEHVLEAHPQRGLGLTMASLSSALDTGIVGYTVLSSDTLGDAIAERIRFGALLRPYLGLDLHAVDDGLVELAILEREPPVLGPRSRVLWIERDLATLAHAWRMLVGDGPTFEAVHCAYRDPLLPERYREVFRGPVRFEQPRSLVRIRRELLEKPMRHAHGEAHRLCEEQCERLLAQMRGGSSVAASVRRALLKRPKKLMDLGETARALQLSERTLGRRLAAEDTSFQQVLTEVRMTLAGDYVRGTPLAIADIAKLVGYGDESSFGRAFRRSFGITPRAFRARADGAGR
jgi:AraC-like DNA-binding protein